MDSSFELLFWRSPTVFPELQVVTRKLATVEDSVEEKARRAVNRMLSHKVRTLPKVESGDHAFFWRENRRWVGPAKVVSIEDGIVTLVFDEKAFISSLNRVLRTMPSIDEKDDTLDTKSSTPPSDQSAPIGDATNTVNPTQTMEPYCYSF